MGSGIGHACRVWYHGVFPGAKIPNRMAFPFTVLRTSGPTRFVVCAVLALVAHVPLPVATAETLQATDPVTTGAESTRYAPILVEADSFELRMDEEKAVWRGAVSASQGNYTFRSSQLTLHLDQIAREPQATSNSQQDTAPRQLSHYELSAATLTYDLQDSIIIGSGGSELRRGKELIRAEQIRYHVRRRVAHAVPGAGGRVQVQFFANPEMPIFPGARRTTVSAGE